ncbi:MAG: hypothetical protein KME57_31530 [Scytonema hyalinum WJT4-NPBG1]|nr:hypothetical protein [Scytonema hyalinum WJT4-NPBG1]
MANATAIAVRAASPEEIRHATRKPAARFALTPVACGGKPFGVRRGSLEPLSAHGEALPQRWTHIQRLYIDVFITVAHQLRDTESFCHALILVTQVAGYLSSSASQSEINAIANANLAVAQSATVTQS